jgi:putative inorganic carbon (HCO3(-)) transporter
LEAFPFTGIGMGCFQDIVNTFYPLRPEPVAIGHAHQLFLQIDVDLGIPGLIAWVGCFVAVVVLSWKLYRSGRQQKAGWLSVVGAGSLGSATALLVGGLFDAVTWGTRAAFIPWLVWGLCVGVWVAWKRR